MLNIDTLDNVIAMIVVILLLSLIVQSLQNLIKKIMRIKSQQIEDSLLDLFDAVLRGQRQVIPQSSLMSRASAMMPRIFRPSPAGRASTPATQLLDAVKGEMKELGRVSARGRFMIDSISKSDLINILARIGPNTIVGQFTAKLQKAMDEIKRIETTVAGVSAAGLTGEANALFAKLREAVAPLQQHYRSLTTGGTVNSGVVVADVLALRDIGFTGTLDLLEQIQKVLREQKAVAGANVAAIQATETSLAAIATVIGDARDALDDAFGSFRTKLTEIEGWFDTAMQGFEERYDRGMKTWSLVLASLVVIVLNANVFGIYASISRNDTLRKTLVGAGGQIQTLQQEIAAKEKARAALPEDQQGDLKKQIAENRAEIEKLAGMYSGFGFQPLTWSSVGAWLTDLRTGPTFMAWLARRGDDLRTLFGWMVMALLLSLGAPFWHDALQSLFGVKNLLQRKNEQRNVEQRRGAGNPVT